ncbi:DUF5677 domain-containing protein [Bdellovibrio bacteriovorus]|uniref:DUF5677 domain-containing protein n=1 Tax=Bdellovibrio bacteriovorus TaxID=959 RepID=UPI0035A6673B
MENRDRKKATAEAELREIYKIVKSNQELSISAGLYAIALNASIQKTFEFITLNNLSDHPEKHFLSLASLRGICEDYICLKYIGELSVSERDTVIQLLMIAEVAQTSEAQREFFRKSNPGQIVYSRSSKNDDYEKARNGIEKILKVSLKKNSVLPSVWDMSKKVDLFDFYKFFYHGTSRFVHFSPRGLLRLGWGQDETKFNFSTGNFSVYYKEFAFFWGNWVLCLLLQLRQSIFESSEELDNAINCYLGILRDRGRWPELVTFEEMNIEPKISLFEIANRFSNNEGFEQWELDYMSLHFGFGPKD